MAPQVVSMVMREGTETQCPEGLGSSGKSWTVVVIPGVQPVHVCDLVWPLPNRSLLLGLSFFAVLNI